MVRTIMKNLWVFALIALGLLWGTPLERIFLSSSLNAAGPGLSPRGSQEIRWTESLDDAFHEAQISNKPILIHFYGDNCPPCRMLEKKAFKDQGLIEAMRVNVIPVRINAEKDRATADRYKVNRWPTDVYLFSNGDEIYRGTSNQDPTVYEKTLERVALRNRDWNLEQRSIAGVRERRQDRRLADMSHSSRSGIPGDGTAPATHPVTSKSSQWTSDGTRPSTAVTVSLTGDRELANSPATSAPTTQRAIGARAVANPYAIQPNEPSVSRALDVPQPTTANDSNSEFEATSGQIALLTAAPGLNGFCPVALQNAIRNPNTSEASSPWVRGNPLFAIRHRGRIYHCESEQARTALLADPDRYAPALSGCDLVEFARTGDWVDGNCEFGFIEQRTGRVFLFSSRANCEEFARNCEAYSQMAGTPAERVASDATGQIQR